MRNQLQLVHQRRLLEQLALLDGLTGIPNRRQFDQRFESEWKRCQRSNQTLSLMITDVDHFKKYNDSLGHAAGDVVLQEIAKILSNSVQRSVDLVARYGGEEFVVLLPDTDAQEAQQVARRILDGVRERALEHPESATAPYITISIGGVSFTPISMEPEARYFEIADAALYQAKASGRNQVVWAD